MNMQSLRQPTEAPRFFETIEAFFAWAEGQPEKYELVNGVPRVLPNVKRGHSLIVSNLIVALAMRLDGDRFLVHTGEFATKTGERSIRFADVMVEPATGALDERLTETALLLVEVLSPSTMHVDFGQKWEEYQRLPNLQAYLILEQNKRGAWLWTRQDDGKWPKDPVIGHDGEVPLPALGVALPFDVIYKGVV